MSGKSILILSPFFRPNVGGVETHLDDLCHYLVKHNYQVFVITYQPLTTRARGLKVEKRKNLQIYRIPWFGKTLFHRLESYPLLEFLYLFPRLFIATFWFMLWKNKKIDVINAHGLTALCITRVITVFFKRRTTVNIHSIYNFSERKTLARLIKWVMKDIDTVMPLAERSKRDLLGAGIPENKLKIYVQWVDQSLFKPLDKESCRKKLNLTGKFFVLFVARFIEKKGMKILFEASKKLPFEIKFLFVGDGPMKKDLVQATREQNNLLYCGRKKQEEMVDYYGACDLAVLPSQYEEGFTRVVLETLSTGRPIVAANKGCLPEMINSQVGILLDPTVKNITQAIKYLYEHPQQLEKLTRNCRPYAVKHFNERNANLITDTYKKKG